MTSASGWSSPQDSSGPLLDRVHAFITRYMAFPIPEQADAVTLWVAHTHAIPSFECTPRLAIQSPEKQSGKTRLLELLDLLVHDPLAVASISASALARVVAADRPTLLIDEVDAVWNRKGGGAEDLRGILNAGYRRSGTIARSRGREVERLHVFGPVALAGIGQLPDTLQDRSIVIRLVRGTPGTIEKLRLRDAEPAAAQLRDGLGRVCGLFFERLGRATPRMPADLSDRAADIWEPLIAIADVADRSWPGRARRAASVLSGRGEEQTLGAEEAGCAVSGLRMVS